MAEAHALSHGCQPAARMKPSKWSTLHIRSRTATERKNISVKKIVSRFVSNIKIIAEELQGQTIFSSERRKKSPSPPCSLSVRRSFSQSLSVHFKGIRVLAYSIYKAFKL